MTDAHPMGVVVDTMIISWLFDDRQNALAHENRELIADRPRPDRVPDGDGTSIRSPSSNLG